MRANPPICPRRARTIAAPAAFVTPGQLNRPHLAGSNRRLLKGRGELHARIFGVSLAALFSVCLVLNAISSPGGRACRPWPGEFGTISADLIAFTQAHHPVAVESASSFRRSANESLPECAAWSARGEEPGY
jgi:hypothetical protein